MLINAENIWNSRTIDAFGDAKNLYGNISGIQGNVTGMSGCCSRIIGHTDYIKFITTNLEDIQILIKKHNLCKISFSLYYSIDYVHLVMDFLIEFTTKDLKGSYFYINRKEKNLLECIDIGIENELKD